MSAPEMIPWGYPLWSHLHREHGLTLLESELQEIVRIARTIPVWEDHAPSEFTLPQTQAFH
jgi:hypothetical protein